MESGVRAEDRFGQLFKAVHELVGQGTMHDTHAVTILCISPYSTSPTVLRVSKFFIVIHTERETNCNQRSSRLARFVS